ncbi:unnamed protein product [Penicillium salamii]|uniref:Uncharacterized protein n=1 Tax=Penicillium salamii TaxID=1612424 RepID=A0A9W4NVG8_9EURO|nr:unnamed protein product [Penicillium salamii]CAG8147167.1 unnamed protein product [Penicillium salamii]CAG8152473.1 unnamed protein product [Penicillium salamii]CAG8244748.1 unnamed protein product [Penicillium salamii]CAG8332354.1 unnamed protein product [Penicillium salamii]
MNEMDSLPPPPWGTLAVEQYLITNWNNSSTKTPDQQRQILVTEFLDMEFIPLEWAEDWDSLPAGIDPPRAPTTEEVDTILRPYRSDVLRWHAMNLFNDQTCPALLRTHYCTDEEEKARHDDLMSEWVDSDPIESEAWWAVLNNADLFNFGSEWRRVYEILPELAGPLEPEVDDRMRIPRARKADDLETFRSDLKTQIAEAKEEAPEAWRDDRDTIIDSLAIGLQKCATRTYLILADEEAFRSGSLYVLYLDGFRNVIREGRMDPEIHDLFGVIGTWMETNEFLEGSTVGEKYRANAELGRELYQLTEEELADPNQ